jgi:myosin heavy subunit
VFKEGKTPCGVKNKDKWDLICKLLEVDKAEFETELFHKEKMGDITIRTPLKPDDVDEAIKALAKGLFDNMFNWLVNRMNLTILPRELKEGGSSADEFLKRNKTIGLLDIFGFENFEKNRFE